MAFATTGYGDFSPQTPAGRSVFVVWAILGVGTLTILVSGKSTSSAYALAFTYIGCLVLQEAGSSRYKNALHSQVFDKAVKKYRKRQQQDWKQHPRPVLGGSSHAGNHESHFHGHPGLEFPSPSLQSSRRRGNKKPDAARIKESEEVAQRALEALPEEIVRMSNAFNEYMRFFASEGSGGTDPLEEQDVAPSEGSRHQHPLPHLRRHLQGDSSSGSNTPAERERDKRVEEEKGRSVNGNLKVPVEMRVLLDELSSLGNISERVKAEILQDEDARKVCRFCLCGTIAHSHSLASQTLFLLSLERESHHRRI